MAKADARTIANRLNAQKSTGPRTEEGKARSRANAFQHGLAGQGVAWPAEEQAEVDAFVAQQVEIERPQDDREMFLATRAAILAWQIHRADRVEAARARIRAGRARYEEMDRRGREVDALAERIEAEPYRAAKALLSTAEGCEWVLDALGEFVEAVKVDRVMPSLNDRLDALCGSPRPGLRRPSRARLLVEALCRNPDGIWPDGVPGLEPARDPMNKAQCDAVHARREAIMIQHRPIWLAELRGILLRRIDEVEAILAAHRAEPDPGLELAELAAGFDPSPAGESLRRYQRSNLRERRATLRELDEWRATRDGREARPETPIDPQAAPPVEPVAGPAPEPVEETPDVPTDRKMDKPSRVESAGISLQAHGKKEHAAQWLRSGKGQKPR